MSQLVACDWRYEPHADRYGGNHRSAQLESLLIGSGFQCISAAHSGAPGRIQALRLGWTAWRQSTRTRSDWRFRGARFTGAWRAAQLDIQQRHPELKAFLWEATNIPVKPRLAKQCGWMTIAVPQTIECLLEDPPKDRRTREVSARRLGVELESLSIAERIYCIGDEDAWLLSAFGLAPRVLPYYPAPDLERRLVGIRHARENLTRGNEVLVLGSVGWPPARRALAAFLPELDEVLRTQGLRGAVAGYGTETLRSSSCPRLTFLGAIEDGRLSELLTTTRALVLFQNFGTGALTRVPEALIAGLPVVGNRMAVRSARHLDGVYAFDSTSQLAELLATDLPNPTQPVRAIHSEAQFLQDVAVSAVGQRIN